MMMLAAMTWEDVSTRLQNPLVVFGLAGQAIFMMRFVVQWYVSERRGRSHVPISFWYLSFAGGSMLLIYGIMQKELVIIAGQAPGLAIYARNLWLIQTRTARLRERARAFEAGRRAGDAAAHVTRSA